jgi:hypothetical protein
MAAIKPESVADFIPESVADFARNTQSSSAARGTPVLAGAAVLAGQGSQPDLPSGELCLTGSSVQAAAGCQ